MFSEEQLCSLRKRAVKEMSDKRALHTLEVEKMAARIGELYLPKELDILRAAALLHDITKEYSTEKQLEIFKRFGIIITKQDILSPKTLHARTAALLIPSLFPEFACDGVISAVRWHTTGKEDMTLAQKIIYLADYIDMSRRFEDCVVLREMFWQPDIGAMNNRERQIHLNKVLVRSFDMTIASIIGDGMPISEETFKARNSLITELCGGAV